LQSARVAISSSVICSDVAVIISISLYYPACATIVYLRNASFPPNAIPSLAGRPG